MASKSRTLYVGITSDLAKRVYQHKNKSLDGFTGRYNIDRLVYFEEYGNPLAAITREKQFKAWSRAKKVFLIDRDNPAWRDLSDEWL